MMKSQVYCFLRRGV